MISVIIPVYNVEKYLDNCIKSVIDQEYTDLEIILVDDGSTDGSGKICDKYAETDDRIKVIHKQNGGLPDARNAGFESAKGEYIGLVDGDDYISPVMYSRLFEVLVKTEADISECRFIKTNDHIISHDIPQTDPIIFNTEAALKELIFDRTLTQTTVNKLYKREIALSVPFIKGVCNEDEFWTYKVFSNCKKIAFIDEKLYYYYQRNGSIINSEYSIKRLDGLKALYERVGFMEHRFPSLAPHARASYLGNCFYAYQRISGSAAKIDKEKTHRRKIYKSFCEEWKKDRIKPRNLKGKIWYRMFKMFPDLTCKLRNKFGIGL